MTDELVDPPADRGTGVDSSYRSMYRFVLEKMDTYPSWVFRMSSELEDAKCKDAVLQHGATSRGWGSEEHFQSIQPVSSML